MVYYLVYCLGGKSQNGDNLILFHGIPLSNSRLGLINTGLTSTFQRDHKGIHSEYLHKHHKHVSNCIQVWAKTGVPKNIGHLTPRIFRAPAEAQKNRFGQQTNTRTTWATQRITSCISMRPVDPKGAGKSTIYEGMISRTEPPLSWGYFPAIFDSRRIMSPKKMSGYRVFFFGIFQIPPQFRNIYLLFWKTKKHPDDTKSFRIIPIVERGKSEHRIEPPNVHCLNMLETFIFPMFLRPLFENAQKSPHFQVLTCAQWWPPRRHVAEKNRCLLRSNFCWAELLMASTSRRDAEKLLDFYGFMVDEYWTNH